MTPRETVRVSKEVWILTREIKGLFWRISIVPEPKDPSFGW